MELVTGALGSLLLKLGELVKEEYGLQKGVKKKIKSLSQELTVVHEVLRKIGDVPPDQLDKLVRLWASEVREASYDMEDIVDTFLVRVEDPDEPTEPHMLRRLRKKVGRLFKKSKFRHKISSLIDDINEKLQEVAARRGRYTLDGIVAKPAAANSIDPRVLNLYKRATELVGIEGPRDDLINMLSLGDDIDVSNNKKMKIVSIVGFGGLGKTTLAKSVYDHLKQGFECRAFVPVGRNPDIKKVFRDILMGLDKETYTASTLLGLDEKQLMDEINEFVKEKRCLIVIDDIWDKKTWELVICALQESNCGNKLVITTRISEVAAYADEAYKIQPLSHDNSEKLLYARIVHSEGKYFDRPSAEACEKVLKKCGGVPLAIITIASLLANKQWEDWPEVYNSIGFGHKGNDDVDNTRKILSFSYYDLPSHLKACLLYLGVFPEDHVIEKNCLIWKWIAEGFISKEQASAAGVGLFELGERCFNELINRSMIQPQEKRYDGYVDACSVHDMVLDLINQLSSEENFVTVLNGGEQQKHDGSISRRLVLHCVEELKVCQLANIAVEKVRSIFASECDFCALCPRLPFVRVVEMAGYTVWDKDFNKDVSDHLGSLLHLRYLRLLSITKLPREVRYLRFLQTLDLGDSRINELPAEVGLLTQLVCLRLPAYTETRVPAGLIGKLMSLQELCLYILDEDAMKQLVEELGLLRELRVLQAIIMCIISESIGSALLESLSHLHNIHELRITGYPASKGMVHEAGWLSSCRHLRFLLLEGFVFSRLPAWINSSLAPNLSYLYLEEVVAVKDQDMETLAKLPELSCLILCLESDTKSVVISIKIHTDEVVGYFRKLRFLKIVGSFIRFDLRSSQYNSSRVASSNITIMPSLESLEFDVHVRSLKDKNLQLGFDKMLGFQNLGTSSLQRVTAKVNCGRAYTWEVEEAEAVLKDAATVHPKHPTLVTDRVQSQDMISRYQREEEALIAAHRKEIENTMEIVRGEMNLLVEVDEPGSLIDNYVNQLSFLLSCKVAGLVSVQARLTPFPSSIACHYVKGYGPESIDEKQRLYTLLRGLNFNGESAPTAMSEPYTPTAQSFGGRNPVEGFYSPELRGELGAGLQDLHAMGDTEILSEDVASEPFDPSPFIPKDIDDDEEEEEEDVISESQQVPVDNYGVVTSEKESTARENNVAKIKVVVRKRPLNRKELSRKEENIITVHDSSCLTVYEPKLKVDLTAYVEKHEFCFDAVLDEHVSNDEVYHETVEPIIPIIFQRTKATCFAYGQTGSGKTYTMQPLPLRAAQDMVRLLHQPVYRNQNFKLWLSYFEIYGGKLFDLLSDRRQLLMREDGKKQVYIVGLQEFEVSDVQVVKEYIERGNAARSTGSTGANEESSRSHAIMQLAVKKHIIVKDTRRQRDRDAKEAKNTKSVGKISFIDLAGSERGADTTDNDRQTRIEGAEINKSLSALKECIRALDNDQIHIPFRGSKLTEVLRDSFVGNSRTVMISCISPNAGSCEHTLNTLRYADRVKSLSKGGNTRKEQSTGQTTTSSRESSSSPSYPLPAEAEEIPNQIQDKRPVDTYRKGTENFVSNASAEPDRNCFSMIPSYSNRGREENGAASGNDRERYDLKSSQTAYTSKAQLVQNSANTQEEEKVTKVSPPRRKAYREDKSDRQSNYTKKDNGPDTGRMGYKMQQAKQQQQQQRPASASASSRQSEKESSCDDVEIDAILEEEEALIAAHRKEIENTIEIVREEMNLLAEVDQPGSLIDNYVTQLSFLLSRRAAGLVSLQARLARFQHRLKEQGILSHKEPSR